MSCKTNPLFVKGQTRADLTSNQRGKGKSLANTKKGMILKEIQPRAEGTHSKRLCKVRNQWKMREELYEGRKGGDVH